MNIWLPAIRAGSGADIYTERLAGALAARGVNATITWFDRYLELVPGFLKYIKPPPNTDIIHANSWNGFAFSRPDSRLVVTVHHCVHDPLLVRYKSPMQCFYHDHLIRKYETSGFKLADRVTAVSNYTSDTVKNIFNIEAPIPIYNGIDTGFFKAAEHKVKNKRFTLLFVGNTTRRKGFDLLKPIMEKLGNDFVLKYTSGFRNSPPPVTGSNMQNIGTLNKEGLVKAYHECDALLFPSRLEGFGYSVCEAMACGKPVIASDNSSLSEIIRHGETGVLCRTDDIDEFCAAARLLASDPGLADKMGKSARSHVMENFTREKMVQEYIDLYESIL